MQEAEALHRAGKLDQAIEDYRLFLAQHPEVVQVRSDLGAALAGAGRYEEAITEYKRALKLQSLPRIRLNLALAYYKANQPALAAKELEAHVALATLYYRVKQKVDGDREQAIVAKLTAEQQAREAAAQLPGKGEGSNKAQPPMQSPN